jgi:anti-sigma regulatory factor (Ser/Thr protein kinase)
VTRPHAAGSTDEFVHPALLYEGPEGYLAGTVPFVLDGLAADEPVAVAVPGPRLQLLRDALGEKAADVHMTDMTVAGRNPGRIIAEILRAAADPHPGVRVRIIGEPIWPGRSAVEYPACVQHEALINLAFAGRAVSILCPYDIAALPPVAIADALATHPEIVEAGQTWSSQYFAPERIIASYNKPLSVPLGPSVLAFGGTQLRDARHAAAKHAQAAGFDEDRVDDIVLVAGELVANSARHGGGAGTLRTWVEDAYFVCEVEDTGTLDDPLAGRRPADGHQLSGRGLLVVHHLADLVRVHTRPGGTTTRAYFRL